MQKKQMLFKTKGMNRDLSVSAFNPEFCFENMNLRLSTNENNTLLSWVNEKGTLLLKDESLVDTGLLLKGIPIGTAVINHKLIVFTTNNQSKDLQTDVDGDYIYLLEYTDDNKTEMKKTVVYNGNLNFSSYYPLETLTYYEAEDIQKVYWVDGRNQPRIINLMESNILSKEDGGNTQFDFIRELELNETVTVQKLFGVNGTFASGVIQYAFTYFTKYGQESNIFYVTPLYYISPKDRGARPDEKVSNAFKITINNIENTHFDYIRIYSIQRTSVNGTPIIKRVQDIELKSLTESTVSFVDTGTSGNTIDPTELLYKGGESIVPTTLDQKDNTLFLGNISIERKAMEVPLKKKLQNNWDNDGTTINKVLLDNSFRDIYILTNNSENYTYGSQLTAYTDSSLSESISCNGFKYGDYYRCGVQFQYKTGAWSEPVYLEDFKIDKRFQFKEIDENTYQYNYINIPTIAGYIPIETAHLLKEAGYRKARAVVVFPEIKDRMTICQGIVCPTLYTTSRDKEFQSSYFFRSRYNGTQYNINPDDENTNYGVIPGWKDDYINNVGVWKLPYTSANLVTEGDKEVYNPIGVIKGVEIEGDYSEENQFMLSRNVFTLHSPDVEYDTEYTNLDYTNLKYRLAGFANIEKTLGDIDIQTETAVVSDLSTGFVHLPVKGEGMHGIVSGAYYDDFVMDDDRDEKVAKLGTALTSCKWIVYPWQSNGSLNNDVKRAADKGTPTSILKKKVISNLRYSNITEWNSDPTTFGTLQTFNADPQVFNSDVVSILKFEDSLYKGNIDTSLVPNHKDGKYFVWGKLGSTQDADSEKGRLIPNDKVETPFNSEIVWKTFSGEVYNGEGVLSEMTGLAEYTAAYDNPSTHTQMATWSYMQIKDPTMGDTLPETVARRNSVRMKYKSTPHLVFDADLTYYNWAEENKHKLAIVDIVRDPSDAELANLFGGTSVEALKENKWVPCGKPVSLDNIVSHDDKQVVKYEYSYGDTYFQRWDCLKTYAFSPDDINQVVEIGSFMLETHVNIDGRYDRNRGQQNNLNMSPQNFNLLNSVYSQRDNFFSYKILDEEDYNRKVYTNQITWTKTKTNGADVDLWTNVTLSSVLDLDGDKGEIRKIIRFNDKLLAFQDTGISQILYNENTQISTTEGVPIEIANSGKVQGKRYLSDTVGCSNKWSIATTPNGIYFMDSKDKSIYLFGGQLQNISTAYGFNTWCKQNILDSITSWDPVDFGQLGDNSDFRAVYDKLNQEVLFINHKIALAFSEKLQSFTSFYDYGKIPFFCTLDDTGIWITYNPEVSGYEEEDDDPFDITFDDSFHPDEPTPISKGTSLWKHQAGEYCSFFGKRKGYWTTLVGNPEPQIDKIFTNIEFRACADKDGELNTETNKFVFTLPFDYLETWNEYQHGTAILSNRNGHDLFKHHTPDGESSLKRRFRIWRCDIPRDNYKGVNVFDQFFDSTFHTPKRKVHVMDRMRNPWIYLKLKKNVSTSSESLDRVEIHDFVMTYFG